MSVSPQPSGGVRKSIALPYTTAPAGLDGSMLGDVGFDPFSLSTIPNGNQVSKSLKLGLSDLAWNREAELIHGRIAQVAILGFIFPGAVGTLPGNEWTGVDAYSYINPLEAWDKAPVLGQFQILLFMSFLEFRRFMIIKEEGAKYTPGDQKIGQTGYNPFGLKYTPAEYEEKQLQELKHCRLAMMGVLGAYLQAVFSGESIAEQLGAALTTPEYYQKAGYFLPEGI
jgi:light-harvesting complex I chlorophyll a/b binding protein 1